MSFLFKHVVMKLKEKARASNLKLQSSDWKNVCHVCMIVTLTPEKSIGTILNKN